MSEYYEIITSASEDELPGDPEEVQSFLEMLGLRLLKDHGPDSGHVVVRYTEGTDE